MITDKEINKNLQTFSSRLSDLINLHKEMTGETITQQSKAMGFAVSNLSKYTGSDDPEKQIPKPRIDQLIRISEYYGVSIDYLIGRTNNDKLFDTDDYLLVNAIADYTGLDRETIQILHSKHTNKVRSGANFPDLINLLVCCNEYTGFFESFSNYLNAKFMSLFDKGKFEEMKSQINDGEQIEIDKENSSIKELAFFLDSYREHAFGMLQIGTNFLDAAFLIDIENALRDMRKYYEWMSTT